MRSSSTRSGNSPFRPPHLDGDVVREQIPWKSLIRSCRQQPGGFKPGMAAGARTGQAVVGPEAEEEPGAFNALET